MMIRSLALALLMSLSAVGESTANMPAGKYCCAWRPDGSNYARCGAHSFSFCEAYSSLWSTCMSAGFGGNSVCDMSNVTCFNPANTQNPTVDPTPDMIAECMAVY